MLIWPWSTAAAITPKGRPARNCGQTAVSVFNAENGGEKMPHCNAMIRERIGYVEEILRAKGKLK